MKKPYIVEKTFTHSNKTCVVIFTDRGHRCGYVAVEKDSPIYGIDYDDLGTKHNYYPNTHGGLTFSYYSGLYPITTKRPLYWFGFDCAHIYDAVDFESYKKYFKKALIKHAIFSRGSVKTLDFCVTECKSLANQLTELENLIRNQTMPDNITQNIYIVTSKTGDETHLIEAYHTEAAAIEHVNRAIEWYKEWIKQPTQVFAIKYDIWPYYANPWDSVTPNIIDDSIIYSWQRVNLNN